MNFGKFFLIFSSLFLTLSCSKSNDTASNADEPKQEKVIVAYVTSWSDIIPNPDHVTHINYAFGHVTDEFNGLRIDNPQRLHKIAALKTKAPKLKVLLSVGGWCSGNFSEMAASKENRLAFAQDCRKAVETYNLDGIDIDWEYPTSSESGISSSPDDTKNFTLLMNDIRDAIGSDKLLTLASVASGKYIDFAAIRDVVDFVNIMTYDIARPPYHHASLYRSELTNGVSCSEAVDAHIKADMPANKLVLGIPFYGHGIAAISDFIDYKDIIRLEGYTEQWDDTAKVPYLTDRQGKMVCTFENARSIAEKCAFANEQDLKGAMYWDYSLDDSESTLRNAVLVGIMK